jgi:hypothetical protein
LVWNLEENDRLYQIFGHRVHPDGYWVRDQEQQIDFPAGISFDAVIDRMIAILQEVAKKQQNG